MRSLVLRVLAVFGVAAATALLAVPASAREYSRYGHHYVGHHAQSRVVHHRPHSGHRYVQHAPRQVYHAPRRHSYYSAPRHQNRYYAPQRHHSYSAPRHHRQYYAPRSQIVVSIAPRHHGSHQVRYRQHH